MESCFFILCRCFVRVDNVIIRILDNRIFHKFETNYLIKESCFKESNIENLKKKFENPSLISEIEIEKNLNLIEKKNEKILF